jgi:hypothetical protein
MFNSEFQLLFFKDKMVDTFDLTQFWHADMGEGGDPSEEWCIPLGGSFAKVADTLGSSI